MIYTSKQIIRENDLIQLTKEGKKIIFCVEELNDLEYIQYLLKQKIQLVNHFDDISLSDKKLFATNFSVDFSFEKNNLHFVNTKYLKNKSQNLKVNELLLKFSNLRSGDYIVHKKYGIGKFIKIETIIFENIGNDFITLEYKNNDKLILPILEANQISRYKYETDSNAIIELDTLSGSTWERKRNLAKNKIQLLAYKILDIIARNKINNGIKFNILKLQNVIDNFYLSFNHNATDSQIQATIDIENDFQSGQLMNRLLCGDVGFGKTEIAMRASFICTIGKYYNENFAQVCIVAPTTFLAKQHYKKFLERFKETKIKIEILSRISTQKEKELIYQQLSNGDIDILIATHAAFSDSISFANLGFLIIDEEQSFGVEQKEKLRQKYKNIHTLFISATPIPRTLQNALYKIIDLSFLSTPPIGRKAIQTEIINFSAKKIQEAVNFELKRNGKILFITPRIEFINEIVEFFEKIHPTLKFAVLHSKVEKTIIDEVLEKFQEGYYNMIIATTILAQGIDIEGLNTIFIYRTEMFGFSQVYQIRGRVGRSNVNGFSYFILRDKEFTNEDILNRLEKIKNLNQLGSGFNVAMADLDNRGAGNLLGEEQSGEIKEIGIELYQEMLEEAINHYKENKDQILNLDCEVKLKKSQYIPDNYISNYSIRFYVYKKISLIKNQEDILNIRNDLEGKFGKIPESLMNIFFSSEVRLFGIENQLSLIKINDNSVIVKIYKEKKINIIKILDKIKANNKKFKLINQEEIMILDLHEYKIDVIKRIIKEIIN